jgi:hypothetical protein
LAVRGTPGDDDAETIAKRLTELGRGLVYGSLTVIAAKLLIDAGDGAAGGGSEEQRKAVGTVLDWPGGKALVVAVGGVVILAGLWHASRLFTRKFLDDLDLDGRSATIRTVVTALGCIGFFARGLVFCMIGWFLVESALDNDPNHTGGLDQALRRLAVSAHGPGVLRLVAVGLIVFGVYRVIEARLRTRAAVTNP